MSRTLGEDNQLKTETQIKRHYTGPIQFANDLDCFPVK
jgi:hypothetical protein